MPVAAIDRTALIKTACSNWDIRLRDVDIWFMGAVAFKFRLRFGTLGRAMNPTEWTIRTAKEIKRQCIRSIRFNPLTRSTASLQTGLRREAKSSNCSTCSSLHAKHKHPNKWELSPPGTTYSQQARFMTHNVVGLQGVHSMHSLVWNA